MLDVIAIYRIVKANMIAETRFLLIESKHY